MQLMVQVGDDNLFVRRFVKISFLDSPESFRRESEILFPEFNIEDWYEKDESDFRNGNIVFDKNDFVHRINAVTTTAFNKCT